MKTSLIAIIFLALVSTCFGQVSVNISYLADTVMFESESIDDALLNENSFRDSELLVFPLKTSSVINVVRMSDFKKTYTGTIADGSGKVIKTIRLDAINNQIILKNMMYGNYILKIEPDDKPIAEIPETETNLIKTVKSQ